MLTELARRSSARERCRRRYARSPEPRAEWNGAGDERVKGATPTACCSSCTGTGPTSETRWAAPLPGSDGRFVTVMPRGPIAAAERVGVVRPHDGRPPGGNRRASPPPSSRSTTCSRVRGTGTRRPPGGVGRGRFLQVEGWRSCSPLAGQRTRIPPGSLAMSPASHVFDSDSPEGLRADDRLGAARDVRGAPAARHEDPLIPVQRTRDLGRATPWSTPCRSCTPSTRWRTKWRSRACSKRASGSPRYATAECLRALPSRHPRVPCARSHREWPTEVLEADVPVIVDFWAPWCVRVASDPSWSRSR